jgi:hypothetical protein
LEASVPNLFSGQPRASTVVGTIIGNNLGRLEPRIDEQTVANDPLANSDPFSRNQDQTKSGLGVSQVEYHYYRPEIVATTPPYSSAGIGTGSNQQPRLVLAYSRMPLANNGQQI